jgi:hypothetical protein
MFTLNKRGQAYYTVDLPNFKTIGEIYLGIDGFYVFAFTTETVSGCFEEYFFTFVSRSLKTLNSLKKN